MTAAWPQVHFPSVYAESQRSRILVYLRVDESTSLVTDGGGRLRSGLERRAADLARSEDRGHHPGGGEFTRVVCIGNRRGSRAEGAIGRAVDLALGYTAGEDFRSIA